MIGDATRLTLGHVKRHIPPGSRLPDDIALLDIAQDLLLPHIHDRGVFDRVTFDGGTALRKHSAGSAGRFSTDIDPATNDRPLTATPVEFGLAHGRQPLAKAA